MRGANRTDVIVQLTDEDGCSLFPRFWSSFRRDTSDASQQQVGADGSKLYSSAVWAFSLHADTNVVVSCRLRLCPAGSACTLTSPCPRQVARRLDDPIISRPSIDKTNELTVELTSSLVRLSLEPRARGRRQRRNYLVLRTDKDDDTQGSSSSDKASVHQHQALHNQSNTSATFPFLGNESGYQGTIPSGREQRRERAVKKSTDHNGYDGHNLHHRLLLHGGRHFNCSMPLQRTTILTIQPQMTDSDRIHILYVWKECSTHSEFQQAKINDR